MAELEKALKFLANLPFNLTGLETWTSLQTTQVYYEIHKWVCGGCIIQNVTTSPARTDGKITFDILVHYYPKNINICKIETYAMLIAPDARRSRKKYTVQTVILQ